jgi:hypothetical protein
MAAGPGTGATAAFAAARPGPRRSHGKAAHSQAPASAEPHSFLFELLSKEDPKLAEQVRKDRSLMLKLRILDSQPIAIQIGHLKDPDALHEFEGGKLRLNPKHALEALTDFADQQLYGPIKLLGGLGDKLASEVKKDPVLMEQLRDWDQTGVQIKLGTEGVSGMEVHDVQIVRVTLDPATPLESLRGHLRTWERAEQVSLDERPRPDDNQQGYVNRNVNFEMSRDADELLSVYSAYFKVDGKIPDHLLNGNHTAQTAQYEQVIKDYVATGEYTVADEKLQSLLQSEPPGVSNADAYRREFSQKWHQLKGPGQK